METVCALLITGCDCEMTENTVPMEFTQKTGDAMNQQKHRNVLEADSKVEIPTKQTYLIRFVTVWAFIDISCLFFDRVADLIDLYDGVFFTYICTNKWIRMKH